MDSSEEPNARSFIVKVWVEDKARGSGQGVWHGHITDVPSHQRRYLRSLNEIEEFIAPHLEEMGVKLGIRWRVRCWFKRLKERRESPA